MAKKKRYCIVGEGQIIEIERGKVYRIRHRLPPELFGGKRKWSPLKTVYGTKADARIALEKYREELEAQLNGEVVNKSLAEYAREYHQRRVEAGTLAESTLEREKYEIKRIEALFGNADIGEIELADVNAAYDAMRAGGASQSSINIFHVKLKQIFGRALKEGIIPKNPCDLVEISDVKRPRNPIKKTFTREQFQELANALLDAEVDGKVVATWIALATAARKGEVLGLIWDDIDFENKTISFSAQLNTKRERVPFLKAEECERVRAIDDNTVNFLENWWMDQSALFYGGGAVPGSAPVCCNDLGEFMSVSTFDKWRRRLYADLGLGHFKVVEERRTKDGHKRYRYSEYKGFRFHDLRHANATFLAGGGVDVKTIQERGGWSNVDVPMNIYAKAEAANNRKAAEAVGKMMPVVQKRGKADTTPGRFRKGSDTGSKRALVNARPGDILTETHRHRAVPMPTEVAQKKVLECFEDEPEGALLSKKDIVARTGIFSVKCMSKALVALQGSGKIERVGSTKAAKYRKAS